MARINVEDEWFSDPTKRRAALVRLIAKMPPDPERQADGLALDAWRLAQRYWKDNEQLIPDDVWHRAGLEPLITCDLAERRPDGIYVRGTKEQAEWIRQRVEAGKSRAKGPRTPQGKFTSENPATSQRPLDARWGNVQRESSDEPAAHQPPAPAPAPALEDRVNPELAEAWAEHARSVLPKLKIDLAKWTDAIRLLRERDGLSIDDVRDVIAFIRSDEFWRSNAISPLSVRGRSKNGLKKIENILLKMRAGKPAHKPKDDGYASEEEMRCIFGK